MQFLARILLAISALAALTVAGYYYTFDVIAWARNAFSLTEAGYVGFNLVGQALAMALMMPVTFLAGTTLPLITHILLQRGGGERSVGRVYAWNTFGCIAGAMLGVHWLLPAVGVKGTILTGALFAGGLATASAEELAVGRWQPESSRSVDRRPVLGHPGFARPISNALRGVPLGGRGPAWTQSHVSTRWKDRDGLASARAA
jgi:hypothetical protein